MSSRIAIDFAGAGRPEDLEVLGVIVRIDEHTCQRQHLVAVLLLCPRGFL